MADLVSNENKDPVAAESKDTMATCGGKPGSLLQRNSRQTTDCRGNLEALKTGEERRELQAVTEVRSGSVGEGVVSRAFKVGCRRCPPRPRSDRVTGLWQPGAYLDRRHFFQHLDCIFLCKWHQNTAMVLLWLCKMI